MSQPPVSRCCRQARPQRIRTQAALQHLPVPPDPRSRHAGDPWPGGSAVALLSITPVTGTEQGHVAMWPVLAANSSLLLTSIFIWGGGRHALLAANTHHRARARSSSPRAVSGACHPRRRCAAATTVVAGRRFPAARALCRPLPPRTARGSRPRWHSARSCHRAAALPHQSARRPAERTGERQRASDA